jgi:O-antigen ligase
MLTAGVIALFQQFNVIPSGLLVNDRGLFTQWIVSLALGIALFNQKLSRTWRGFLLSLAVVWIYVRFNEQITWVSGWLPTFVAVGTLILMRSKKLLFSLLIIVVVFISLNADYYLGKVIQDEADESGDSRLEAWEVNWRVTGKHLFLGTGPAGYAAYYMSYYPADAMATHSNYVDLIAQTGIPGLVLSVWLFFALVRLGYRLRIRLKGRGDFSEGLANAALAGTISCIVAMAFGDWLFPFAYTQSIDGYDYVVYSWLFMGTILVLDRLHPVSIEEEVPG